MVNYFSIFGGLPYRRVTWSHQEFTRTNTQQQVGGDIDRYFGWVATISYRNLSKECHRKQWVMLHRMRRWYVSSLARSHAVAHIQTWGLFWQEGSDPLKAFKEPLPVVVIFPFWNVLAVFRNSCEDDPVSPLPSAPAWEAASTLHPPEWEGWVQEETSGSKSETWRKTRDGLELRTLSLMLYKAI